MQHSLRIQEFEVWVHLGCSEEEQKFTQPVHFTIELQMNAPILGAKTDKLSDAIDYVQLTEIIKKQAEAKNYKLVEHLGSEALNQLATYLKSKKIQAKLSLQTKKIRVPVENLKNGVVFTCETQL